MTVPEDLLAERVHRDAFTSVGAEDIARWCAVFEVDSTRYDSSGADCVAPPEMVTTFLRPPTAPAPGQPLATNVALHERLKESLGLPVGIATSYELEAHALVRPGDRLVSVERIADVGPERDTRFGRGRDWSIEVASSFAEGRRAGELVCVERWHMTGYDPARIAATDQARGPTNATDDGVDDATEGRHTVLTATRDVIVGGATANRVWAAAHHDDGAAAAAGLPGIILDTSTWVAIAARDAVGSVGGEPRVGSVDLSMRRPVLVDDVLDLHAVLIGDAVDAHDVRWATVRVTGRVRGRVCAQADVRLAVATADGVDVWGLAGERWDPRRS